MFRTARTFSDGYSSMGIRIETVEKGVGGVYVTNAMVDLVNRRKTPDKEKVLAGAHSRLAIRLTLA
jgi:hypothetical protein